ncbi:redox-sensing transcriptional repressor Rex 1 [Tepiditoga spiralis]|uniref:Redox-sensing transcriptional repressor Rex n=1 Tax=Tepiditoga spiralis TaxID=2108365 RepID=A0A7G1G665_9BACT|nr:redox-sensing transcriptional repressor Rex [Tepiditoga spiralis]BBE30836.1 redox-sensing transcriptional repressor Rex 1 [Tepiditoga spiralis]
MLKRSKIPKPTVKRLAVYFRCITKLSNDGIEKTSSKEIAERLSIKASQVRKDLSYFGEFGKRGVGYDIEKLSFKLREILGLEKLWNVAIVGSGNLGFAIANYSGLEANGFKVVSAFDIDEKKIGNVILPGVTIKRFSEFSKEIKEKDIEIAILTVPANVAQDVADKVIDNGIKGILNFCPVPLSAPENVSIEDVDFVISLKALTFEITSREQEKKEQEKRNNA